MYRYTLATYRKRLFERRGEQRDLEREVRMIYGAATARVSRRKDNKTENPRENSFRLPQRGAVATFGALGDSQLFSRSLVGVAG